MKIGSATRQITKLATSGSVQIMLGGLVAAVIPKQISIVYKIATWIGSTVVASFVGDKLDEYVDEKLNDVEELATEIQDIINENSEKNIVKEGAEA